MMQILHTFINKKVVYSIIIVLGVVLLGGGSYILYSYISTPKTTTEQTKKVELPTGATLNVTVNNFLDGVPKHEESKPTLVLPKIEQTTTPTPPASTLMAQPPVVVRDQQPVAQSHMLIVGETNKSDDSTPNAITGTNTTIGTGVIDSKLQHQRSPYTIFAGTFLPATMLTGMNSDLSGEIVASIRNNVYDSTDGKYLIIPQGSRLIGTYSHDVAYAQNRLMVGWNRVIYPNGSSFVLQGQPGTDLQGFSGFSGTVDNHYEKTFGSAFLMGLIFGGMTNAVGNQGTNPSQLSAGATMATQIGTQMSQTGVQVIAKGINIPPTIVVSPGYKFNILTTADLILKPYIYK